MICPWKKLAQIIQPGGIHNKRAQFIKSCLAKVYKANTTGNPNWDGKHTRNEINALDFVPGLLSLSFLDGMTKVELLNWLLSLDGVGVKTAHCVMEFNFRLPVCAVDTHVLFMAAALGWLPAGCYGADSAAMHLDARLPDAVKHDLHQAFWNHRQHCEPCKKGAKAEMVGRKMTGKDKCVLEDILKRRIHRSRSLKTAEPKDKTVVAKKTVTKVTTVQKAAKRPFDAFTTAEKAAAEGYQYVEMEIDDDFAAGSVNKTIKKWWELKKSE